MSKDLTQMPRPGFVLEVDRSTPPTCSGGARASASRSCPPIAHRVIYPPEPLAGISDLDGAIRNALLNPIEMDPLPALLRPGMKLTIAFDDASLSLPKMRRPDNRQRIIEAVLDLAAEAGVDDIHLIAALGLHRRMNEYELRHVLGDRIYDAFHPRGMLYQHDAEDYDNLAVLGTTDEGEVVEINKRAADSDLIVYANVNLVAMDGGWKSTITGLASYRCLSHHHNPEALQNTRSLMDHAPQRAAQEHLADGQGARRSSVDDLPDRVDDQHRHVPGPFDFLRKREWEWNAEDRASYLATTTSLNAHAQPRRRKIFHSIEAPYADDERAGRRGRGRARAHARARVPPAPRRGRGPDRHPHDGHPVHLSLQRELDHEPDPRDVHGARLPLQHVPRQAAGARGRRGDHDPPDAARVPPGAPPELHRLLRAGAGRHHRPARDVDAKYEEQFAEDEWYRHLYRTSYAYHGVHPFYMWYWGAHGCSTAGRVIIVGGDAAGRAPARLHAGVDDRRRARDRQRRRRALPDDHPPARPADPRSPT